MNDSAKNTVAIIEDNKPLGETLRKVVKSDPGLECCGVWETAEDGLKKTDAFRPDVILMDINLPGMSGIEATGLIKQHLPEILVIMVTVYGDHDKIFAALKAGASGYLLKRSSPGEIRDAIHDVLGGGAPMSAEIARRVVEAFHQQGEKDDLQEANLSKRELEVLKLLSEGLANKEISDKLGISVDTVRVHNRNIYDKLHVNSRTQAAMKYQQSSGSPPV
ncbi:MAG: response regulator transcription factor [Akkermansiaceae bacterium]|jgi:DNA-binding NarL/FixJ family response regulator